MARIEPRKDGKKEDPGKWAEEAWRATPVKPELPVREPEVPVKKEPWRSPDIGNLSFDGWLLVLLATALCFVFFWWFGKGCAAGLSGSW